MPDFALIGDIIRAKTAKYFAGRKYQEYDGPVNEKEFGSVPYDKDEAGLDFASENLPEIERPPLRHIDKYIAPECPCLTKRYTMSVLTCLGFIITFGMRCNMSIAKLQLLGNRTEEEIQAKIQVFRPEWSVGVESAIDSSFYWGYLITQVPGGFLASKYPANKIFGKAVVISSILNLFVPGAIRLHPAILIIVRICQGLVEGVTYPATHGILRHWAPPLERSRLATLAFCGSYAGVVISYPLSGTLVSAISWQAPFYFYGVCGLIWYCCWLWLTFEKPRFHPTISPRELLYIEKSLGSSTEQPLPTISTTPWNAFFHSMPVYAIMVANFCRSWNFYFLVLSQPTYLHSVYDLETAETGFVGALPHLLMTVIVPFGGLLADHIRKEGILSTTNVRKLFNCGGFGVEAFFFIVVAYSNSAFTATVALCIGVAASAFAISGFNVNHLDIAPRYASILMGMSNGIGTIAGMANPIVVDHITADKKTHQEKVEAWRVAFLMAAFVHFCGVIFYAVFASGELQPWAETDDEKTWNPMENVQSSTQPNGRPPVVSYGSVDQSQPHPDYINPVVPQPVQPPAQDEYMNEQRNLSTPYYQEPVSTNPFKPANPTNPFLQ
ncbi:unnamed protein product [Bemisia tabaci]|uniref:Major facilitator superfamily (MFS) profile domain-containing protein n=1 Tax=Bemisia tabaci TaxID=7038 RepID=A0A9P0CB68_BEMTA|nr:PREDICTED: vesicular glutamate transporter 1 [Bemisia tabaci]CAH0768421.1 unnamed protein product [Bemisia tabaci]